jgi:hypothetical protein
MGHKETFRPLITGRELIVTFYHELLGRCRSSVNLKGQWDVRPAVGIHSDRNGSYWVSQDGLTETTPSGIDDNVGILGRTPKRGHRAANRDRFILWPTYVRGDQGC